jgi:hypothetical protein
MRVLSRPALLALALAAASAGIALARSLIQAAEPAGLPPNHYATFPCSNPAILERFPDVELWARIPLWEIEEVVLAIHGIPLVEAWFGIEPARLRTHCERMLREAGLRVVELAEAGGDPRLSRVSLELNAQTLADSDELAYNVALGVDRLAVPVADPRVVTHARIWQTSYLGMSRGEPTFVAENLGLAVESCFGELRRDLAEMNRRAPRSPVEPESQHDASDE